MPKLIEISLIILTLLSSTYASGQKYNQDVQSIESIMSALTEVISGSANQERDWNRFYYLFSEDAKLIPTYDNQEGDVSYNYWSPQDYVEMYKKNRSGSAFYEQELFRKTDSFRNVAHCFSTYAVRTEKDGPITRRGINSIQLLKRKDRWYIMSVFWTNETEKEKLPSQYLPDN